MAAVTSHYVVVHIDVLRGGRLRLLSCHPAFVVGAAVTADART